MDLDKAIKTRHSVRRFKNKSPNWRDIIKAIDLARLAPSAGNIHSIRFIVVTEDEKLRELAEACQQDFVGTAKYVVVICTDPAETIRHYGERGKKYCTQQTGAAIENFLLKLTELKLATCWVGAFADEQVKQILQIPENCEVEALFPIGYEMPPKSKQKPKRKLDHILFFNIWGNKYMHEIKKVEAI